MRDSETILTKEQVEDLLGFDYSHMPVHIAIIPDGNGRWAKKRGLPRIEGHRKGIMAIKTVVRGCRRLGVKYLTFYAFSTENWSRPDDEISGLWQLLEYFIEHDLPELSENGVKLKVIGQINRIPKNTIKKIDEALEKTAGNDALVLTIALSYSGRRELVRAARHFAKDALAGRIGIDKLDENRFADYLYTKGMPDPDLLIRSSGEMRISNYLLWQLAYSEIFITEKYWPDFDIKTLHEGIKSFGLRERRFGKTGDQLIEQ